MCFTNSSLVPPRGRCVALLGIPISWFNDANVLLQRAVIELGKHENNKLE